MAIRKIARMGHPVLRRAADAIADPTAAEIAALIADMRETMVDAEGAGLAAPQVYAPLQLVMFHTPADGERPDDLTARELTVLINPEIVALDDSIAVGWEGCLSVPGLRGAVPRHDRIGYRGLAPDGRTIEREAQGFHARVVQHECDHLLGVLYPMRMDDLSQLIFTSEWKHFAAVEGADDGAADE